jgi:hypothetical protein
VVVTVELSNGSYQAAGVTYFVSPPPILTNVSPNSGLLIRCLISHATAVKAHWPVWIQGFCPAKVWCFVYRGCEGRRSSVRSPSQSNIPRYTTDNKVKSIELIIVNTLASRIFQHHSPTNSPLLVVVSRQAAKASLSAPPRHSVIHTRATTGLLALTTPTHFNPYQHSMS